MFSIIIPLYNKAPYIQNALNSIINQSFKDFEVIIIDDGSTDDGVLKVNEFFQRESTPFTDWRLISQQNKGVSSARNYGVSLAKFEFIAFLDADDWWATDYLLNMKGLIDSYPEAGIYGSSYYKVKNNLNIPASIGVDKGFTNGLINYFKVYANTLWMPLWTGATIIKKSAFIELNGFKASLKLGEDFDLWLRVALKHPVAYISKPLAYYNQDVELANRAIGLKHYEPQEHVLFQDYSEIDNPDFKSLFEKLALYGFLPYYASGKNLREVKSILKGFNWKNHPFKYRLIYRYIPRFIFQSFFKAQMFGSQLKRLLLGLIKS